MTIPQNSSVDAVIFLLGFSKHSIQAFLSIMDNASTIASAGSYDPSCSKFTSKPEPAAELSQQQDSKSSNQKRRAVFPNVFNATSKVENGT